MNVRATGAGIASSAASPITSNLDSLADDLVKFAESKPTSMDVLGAKLQAVQAGPLGQPMLEILQKLAPVVGSAKSMEDQIEVFAKAAGCLQKMRQEIAGGRAFELARAFMGTQNDRVGALLASGVDSPFKLNLAWAMFELSALAGQIALAEKQKAKVTK